MYLFNVLAAKRQSSVHVNHSVKEGGKTSLWKPSHAFASHHWWWWCMKIDKKHIASASTCATLFTCAPAHHVSLQGVGAAGLTINT